jgi:GntP family gluconate:H+ symporter
MTLPLSAAAAIPQASNWPFVILLVCVAFVIVAISVLRLHPFLALIFAAILAGVMADKLPAVSPSDKTAVHDTIEHGRLKQALDITTKGFGDTAGGIAIVIGMATIIGMALMESGAADKVVRRFLAVMGTGPKGISFAIVISTYILSIPIFFDSMFMLMIPIAMAMALRTGRDFTLYVLAICAGGTITHSRAVPHPGPLFMVDNLGIDIGLSLWVGLVVGLVPVVLSWAFIQYLNRLTPIELRETPAAPLHGVRAAMERPESDLPSLFASLLPIVLPILLISATSVFEMVQQGYEREARQRWVAAHPGAVATGEKFVAADADKGPGSFRVTKGYVDFIGNKNTALIVGALIALAVLARQRKRRAAADPGVRIADLIGPPLETGGVIILITAAGGAFGYVLANAGVADALKRWAAEHSSVNLIFLAYAVSLVFRVAQGSATVAMQTTSAMMAGMVGAGAAGTAAVAGATVATAAVATPALPYHPIYLFCAIGFGAIGCSWMNDSGFWVVSRLSGFTERQTLRTWSVLLTFISVVGVLFTWLLSIVLPFAGK